MNLFSKIKLVFGTDSLFNTTYLPNAISGNNFDSSNADNISSVFTCIKILAETISKLPLEVYQNNEITGKLKDKNDYRYSLLHYNVNNYTNAQTFFSAMEYYRNITGNAFAKIHRQNGKVITLEIIPSKIVTGYKVTNNELYYELEISDTKKELINSNDILHFRSALTRDGIWGINPIEALRINLSSTYKGLQTIDKFYENNANSTKAIKSTVAGANQKQMLEAIKSFQKEYSGHANAGKMIPLPPNTELQELQLNFADAQFIETVRFNSQQIASLYGIPLWMVGDTTATKFNSVEQMTMSFKINTISAIGRLYRQELEMKLLTTKERVTGKSIEFNYNAMIDVDHRTRLEGYRTLFNIGAISSADIQRFEGFPTYSGAEKHYVPMNMLAVEDKNIDKNNEL